MNFNYENLIKYKNNTLIIYQIDNNIRKLFTFDEIIEKAKLINDFLDALNIFNNHRISLKFAKCPEIIVLILSLINRSNPFCPISIAINNPVTILNTLEQLKSNYLFSNDEIYDFSDNIIFLDKIKIFDTNCYFYKVKIKKSLIITLPNHLCSIKTSGSTGEPKIVHVPNECISPNIISLSKIYSMSNNDVIYISSPPTFDPFIVDVFLAFHNGCSLFISSSKLELNKKLLSEILFQNSTDCNVTIMCITPSVFKLFGNELIRNTILINQSSLRILTFGGENFPNVKEIKIWLNQITIPYNKRLFNIYGITEVSCWASIEEIIIKSFEELENLDKVPIGSELDSEIILRVKSLDEGNLLKNGMGELLIGSKKRKCLIDDESLDTLNSNNTIFRSTGDLVDIKDNKIRYIGRKNSIIKRFGHRVCLTKIENYFKSLMDVEDAIGIFENSQLIVFLKNTSNLDFQFYSNCLLAEEKPDKILSIKEIPLCNNGKISKQKLLDIYKKSNISISLEEIFQKRLETISGIEFTQMENLKFKEKRMKSILNSSFIELGGNSFQAINILNELEDFSHRKFPHIFEMLLNPEIKIDEIYKSIKNNSIYYKLEEVGIKNNNEELLELDIDVAWKFNTTKCIDATPSILLNETNVIISVGSHSHQLINIDLKSGEVLSSINLLDRIESKVEFDIEKFGYVGCYNGYLYKFNPNDGNILWKFNSNGMIKCKPLYNDNLVIFGNYIKNTLYALNSQTGTVNWQIETDASILSAPFLLDPGTVIFCTLNGTILSLDVKTGNLLKTCKLKSPIFSNAIKLEENMIIIAEASGLINFMNRDLDQIATYQADGNIFSSFGIKKLNENEFNIIFGCFDHNIYNLIINGIDFKVNLKWKCKLQSQIYGTPKIFDLSGDSLIVACTTIGWINILYLESSNILKSIKLDGEIFSSPEIFNNDLIIGCRDNFLYCFKIDKKKVMVE